MESSGEEEYLPMSTQGGSISRSTVGAMEDDGNGEYLPMSASRGSVSDLLRGSFPRCVSLVPGEGQEDVNAGMKRYIALGARVEQIAHVQPSHAAPTFISETDVERFDERHCVLLGDVTRLGNVEMDGVADVLRLPEHRRPAYVRAIGHWSSDDDESAETIVSSDIFRVTTKLTKDSAKGVSYVEWRRLCVPLSGVLANSLDSFDSNPCLLSMGAKCKFSTVLDPALYSLRELATLHSQDGINLPIKFTDADSMTAVDEIGRDIPYSTLSSFRKKSWLVLYQCPNRLNKPGLYRMSESSTALLKEMTSNEKDVRLALACLLSECSISRLKDCDAAAAPMPDAHGGACLISPPSVDLGEETEAPPRLPVKLPGYDKDKSDADSSDDDYNEPYELLKKEPQVAQKPRSLSSLGELGPTRPADHPEAPHGSHSPAQSRRLPDPTKIVSRSATLPNRRSGDQPPKIPPRVEKQRSEPLPMQHSLPADTLSSRMPPTGSLDSGGGSVLRSHLYQEKSELIPTFSGRKDVENVILRTPKSLPSPKRAISPGPETRPEKRAPARLPDARPLPTPPTQPQPRTNQYLDLQPSERGYVAFEPPPSKQAPAGEHGDIAYYSTNELLDDEGGDGGGDGGVEHVCKVLRHHSLSHYETVFRSRNVDLKKFVGLTNSTLMNMFGVKDASERIKILQLVDEAGRGP